MASHLWGAISFGTNKLFLLGTQSICMPKINEHYSEMLREHHVVRFNITVSQVGLHVKRVHGFDNLSAKILL
jgi:hypothetical protein